ncbi:MAG: hypothetical protein ABI211_03855 [Vicinamibacterales bacterium]
MSAADQNAAHRASVADYCRLIERHLCQKNGGHLVRVVGPAFDEVRGWAEQGIPIKIALRGIDQCCERAFAKGPRRRPIRVEFCAADVKELFDDWRRAVGVSTAADGVEPEAAPPKGGLAAHVERVIARLIALRNVEGVALLPAAIVDDAVASLDRIGASAGTARGDAREALIDQLAALDRALLTAAAGLLDGDRRSSLQQEAASDLAPFGQRMTPAARAAAVESAYLRLVRDALRLPRVSFD